MRIIATPIILENFEDWVILSKAKVIDNLREHHWEISKENPFEPLKILETLKYNDIIRFENERYIIMDRKYYDISFFKEI